jgi:DnaJ-class molecular chaperone
MTTHPDRNSGSVAMGREFDEITCAYRTLDEYCQGERCSFDPASFQKRSIQVCVRK